MKCSVKNIVLPSAPKPTRPMRVYLNSEKVIPKRFEDEDRSRHPVRNGRDSWSKAETKAALEMWEEGHGPEDIAKLIGRTTASVEGKINRERAKGKTNRRRVGHWTEKDTQILHKLLAEGKKTTEIAAEMCVSLSTIQRHMRKEKEESEEV